MYGLGFRAVWGDAAPFRLSRSNWANRSLGKGNPATQISVASRTLGHFQMGRYRYRSLIEGLYTF